MSFRPAPISILLLVLGCVIPAGLRAAEVEFHLPAAPAADALLEFSSQAGMDVLFPFDALRRVRSGEVTGFHEPEAALELLLLGTGFAAHRNGAGKFVITPVEPATGATRAAASPADGPAAPEEGEPVRLESFTVIGRPDLAGRHDAGPPPAPAQTAAGNLDLPRTEDDALTYTIYTRDQLDHSGVANLNEFLQREVLDSSAETPDPGGSPQNLFSGSSNLNLRGYGTDETVVLVNGRRLPPIVTVGSDPQNGAPDVSLIPLNLVEKVEVLPVSASALYSGNPVGGVINIVLRSAANVNTTELTVTTTNALRGFNAPEDTMSLLNLETLLNGALHVRLDASFTQSTPPTEAELGYHQAHAGPPPPIAGSTIYGATPNVTSATPEAATGAFTPLFGPGTPTVTSVAPGADGGGLAAFSGRPGVRSLGLYSTPGGALAASPDSLDYGYGENERRAVFYGSADYAAFPWLQVGFDGTYARTVINPGDTVLPANLNLAANSPFNPFQQNVTVALNDTAPLLGAGYNQAQVQFASGVLGLIFKPVKDWRVSFDGQYADTLSQDRGVVGADPTRWQGLVDQGIYNPLRDTQVFGPPQAFYDQVLIYEGGRGKFATLGNYDTLDTAVRVTNSALALPTGTAILNLGSDYRRDHFSDLTDPLLYGDGSSAGTTLWTGRTLQEYSAFSELQASLLPAAWLPGWLNKAETDLAVRYDAGAVADERNVSPTFGVKLDFAGGFSLRGSVTTASRFPTPQLSQQVLGPAVGGTGTYSVSVFDPRRDQTYVVAGSDQLNPVLEPEQAVTETVGGIFEHGSVERFRASLDLVDTVKHNEVVYLDPQTVVDLESLLPARVQRAPAAPGAPAGAIASLLTGAANLYLRHSDNLEASFLYSWNECAGGTLEVYERAVYFLSYERQVLAGSPLVNELTLPDGSAPDLLRFRDNFGASWSDKSWGLGWDGHFFGPHILPVLEWPSQGGDQIGRYWQFDSYLQADLGRWLPWKSSRYGLRAQLRVNNVFGWSYPFYADESSGAGVEPYGDWRGRTYSLSLTATF